MNRNSVRYKLIYVGFSFLHHGRHSGYDNIKNVIPYDKYFDCQKDINYMHSIPAKRNILPKIYLILFGDRPWWVELRCIIYALFHRNLIFHFIYSEKIYRYSGLFKGKTNKIVCTLHQTADFYKARPQFLKGSSHIDKIIVLTSDNLEPIQKLYKNSKIYYVPHGVDTTYFKPLIKKKTDKKILMVGNWKRNFNFADQVFQKIISSDQYVTINVVTNKENHKNFTQNKRLNLLSEISDDHLLDLYQTSGILFLPLFSFTANNALLEGAACGCKIIIATEQPTDSCYIEKKYIDIAPFDVQMVTSKILERLNNQDENCDEMLVDFVRRNYDWKLIGKLTQDAILGDIK